MPSRRKQQLEQEAARDDSANEEPVVDLGRDGSAEQDGFASDSSEEGRPSRNTSKLSSHHSSLLVQEVQLALRKAVLP